MQMNANRLADSLRKQIEAEDYKPGHQLPSKKQLQTNFGVSQATIQGAFDALSAEGLVEGRPGAGLFVLPPAQPIAFAALVDGFEEPVEPDDVHPVPRWVRNELGDEVDAAVAVHEDVLLTRWTPIGTEVEPTTISNRIQAKAAGSDERQLLALRTGTPVLAVHRLGRNENGTLVRIDRYTVVGGRYLVDLEDLPN